MYKPDPQDDGTPGPGHNPEREEPGEPVPVEEPGTPDKPDASTQSNNPGVRSHC